MKHKQVHSGYMGTPTPCEQTTHRQTRVKTLFSRTLWQTVTITSLNSEHSMKAKEIYRLGTVNSKSFVGKVLLRIKRKFEFINAL